MRMFTRQSPLIRSWVSRQLSCSARHFSSDTDDNSEVAMLTRLLEDARKRQEDPAPQEKMGRTGPRFNIATFNAISPIGLGQFDSDYYNVKDMQSMLEDGEEPHVIMLRSHKLQLDEIPKSVRCIARCGAGTNNIPVEHLTNDGIPVFNTPGANANAVKEAVICGLLLASRGIHEGISHTHNVIYKEAESHADAAARIEKDKKMFGGRELSGKTIGVVGLGHIGGKVVDSALSLGMNAIGYDPCLSLDAAWRLPGDRMKRASSLEDLLRESDYVSLHVPYMPATHHLLSGEALRLMKPNASIVNFARGELVDSEALASLYESGDFRGKLISDFADPYLQNHPKVLTLPHLGASSAEAEENSATMAANTIMDFLTTGAVQHSVNLPTMQLKPKGMSARLCIVNRNEPGILGRISSCLGAKEINIAQQLNMSRDKLAYTVLDIEGGLDDNQDLIQEGLGEVDGVLSSRFIGQIFQDDMGLPGTFYKVYDH